MAYKINTERWGQLTCVNEDKKYWNKYFLVSFDNHTGWDSAICVNADHEQNAIDAAADYAEDQGWEGYFLDPEDEHSQFLDECGEVLYVGNHGRWVDTSELQTLEITDAAICYEKITIEIDLENDAFQYGNLPEELKRIFDHVVNQIERGTEDDYILDINGNRCGEWKLKKEQ